MDITIIRVRELISPQVVNNDVRCESATCDLQLRCARETCSWLHSAPSHLAPAPLTLPQPLYGIDRPTVDAQFEVEAVGARRGRPHGPDGLAVLHAGAFLDGNFQQIAVQGERLRSVV